MEKATHNKLQLMRQLSLLKKHNKRLRGENWLQLQQFMEHMMTVQGTLLLFQQQFVELLTTIATETENAD